MSEDPVVVFVGGLQGGTTEDEVRDVVAKYGKVNSVRVRGAFAFVEFTSRDDAMDCIDKVKTIGEQPVRCELSRGRGPRGGTSGRGCFNCGEEGHKSHDCPKKGGGGRGGDRDRRGGGGRDRGCFNCGKEGHLSRDCPNPRGERKDRDRHERDRSQRRRDSRDRRDRRGGSEPRRKDDGSRDRKGSRSPKRRRRSRSRS
eukprot:PhF_6_TR33017/c0_g1_i1/m.48662